MITCWLAGATTQQASRRAGAVLCTRRFQTSTIVTFFRNGQLASITKRRAPACAATATRAAATLRARSTCRGTTRSQRTQWRPSCIAQHRRNEEGANSRGELQGDPPGEVARVDALLIQQHADAVRRHTDLPQLVFASKFEFMNEPAQLRRAAGQQDLRREPRLQSSIQVANAACNGFVQRHPPEGTWVRTAARRHEIELGGR